MNLKYGRCALRGFLIWFSLAYTYLFNYIDFLAFHFVCVYIISSEHRYKFETLKNGNNFALETFGAQGK